MKRRWIGGAVWWALQWALYMLLAGNNEAAEWAAGAMTAALGTAVIAVVSARRKVHFAPRPAWFIQLRRLPGQVLADSWTVTLELGRMLLGRPARDRFRAVPFDPGGQDASSAARRALVTAWVSVAPNSDVIAIDPERRTVLIHQLVPSPEPPGHGDREWPL